MVTWHIGLFGEDICFFLLCRSCDNVRQERYLSQLPADCLLPSLCVQLPCSSARSACRRASRATSECSSP
jgi:hypothetical protein